MKRFGIVLFVILMSSLSLHGCEIEEILVKIDEASELAQYVVKNARAGEIVHVQLSLSGVEVQIESNEEKNRFFEFDNMPEMHGIIVGQQEFAIVIGCYGYDWCVEMDELSRGIFKSQENDYDVGYYGEVDAEEPPGGTTLFSQDYYPVYFYNNNASHTVIRAAIAAYSSEVAQKRQAYCAGRNKQCWQQQIPTK